MPNNLTRTTGAVIAVFAMIACSFSVLSAENGAKANLSAETILDTESSLTALFQAERAFHYKENPGTGPRGRPAPVASSMPRVSTADQERRKQALTGFLAALEEINRSALKPDNQINFDMFRYKLETDLLFLKHRSWRLPLYSDSGFHTSPATMWRRIAFRSAADYEAYIGQLADLPRYLAEHESNLRIGMAEGFTMPKVVLEGLLPTFRLLVSENVKESGFYTPFRKMLTGLPDEEKIFLRQKAVNVIEDLVFPAYAELATFMEAEYYQAARSHIAAYELPDGQAYYGAMVRYYTTLDITPDEVHKMGLREVARIRAEMEQTIKASGFEGSFSEFLSFLRTDPQFYAKSEKELLMHASYLAKKIDGRIPSLFGHLPRQPYGVEAVPENLAANYSTGRYLSAPRDAPRGGYYWVNSYALDKRPLYNLPALTLHEAVPGHHLQISLAAELADVPEFRLDMYPHAFGEGWGLYSEKLGLEMDIYSNAYEHFGRLSYEMWRACRLVIDTGIHAKGWTRAQAIQLLEDNSALSTHNIRTEVDRYIAWPGQALAYKMGELKILELRKRAHDALGEKFNVKSFHDKVLSAGGVPLYILEARIDAWIKDKLAE